MYSHEKSKIHVTYNFLMNVMKMCNLVFIHHGISPLVTVFSSPAIGYNTSDIEVLYASNPVVLMSVVSAQLIIFPFSFWLYTVYSTNV